MSTLVEVQDLRVQFGHTPIIKGISFSLAAGECLALVGESGSGKTVTSRTLSGLSGEGSRVQAARLAFAGTDLRQLDDRAWQTLRGAQIGFVMQDALGSLDPLRPVGKEIAEPLRLHTPLGRDERQARVIELLRAVGVPQPELRALQYPHQLSGGLRQRALIASAIAAGPRLLIADEPTTALDATVQAQVLALLESLRSQAMAMLVVSHDLAVVSRLADRVAVMHHGVIVEQGPVEAILHDPQHPYTQSLLRAGRAVHFQRPALAAPKVASAERFDLPLIEARNLQKPLSAPTASPMLQCTTPASACAPGKPWELSASPAAARPPSPACCWAWSARTPAMCGSTAGPGAP